MKNKRVGTFSMALVLIGFGVLMLIGQFSHISAVNLAIKFWPLILILLGGEILYYSIKSKKDGEDIIIRYDIFSVFIVSIILFTNIAIYGLIETGIMDFVKTRISTYNYMYDESYR